MTDLPAHLQAIERRIAEVPRVCEIRMEVGEVKFLLAAIRESLAALEKLRVADECTDTDMLIAHTLKRLASLAEKRGSE
jgi:hypothetical protein